MKSKLHIVHNLAISLIFISLWPFASTLSAQDSLVVSIDTSDYIKGNINYNLLIASYKGYGSEIIRLLNMGASIDYCSDEGLSPLMYAVSERQIEAVKILLLNGADPNFDPFLIEPPLVISARNGFAGITEELIISGAYLLGKDQYGASPLHYAAAYNYPVIADMLLYYGAKADVEDYSLTTPLMAATYSGNIGVARLLIKYGAQSTKKDINGITPLMIAAQAGDSLFAGFLIDNGARLGSKSVNGNSALNSAISNDHTSVLDLFYIKKSELLKKELKNTHPYLISRKYSSRNTEKWLREHNIKKDMSLGFSELHLGGGISVNQGDALWGFAAGLKEDYTGICADLEYRTRIGPKRVLYEQDNNNYYQFWEKRRMSSVHIYKLFKIMFREGISGPSAGIRGLYIFGPLNRGSELKPEKLWKISPTIGWSFKNKNYRFDISYEYLSLEYPDEKAHWINLSLFYNIPLKANNFSNKEIPWY